MSVQLRINGKDVLLLGRLDYSAEGMASGYINVCLPMIYIAHEHYSDGGFDMDTKVTWGFSATTAITFTKNHDESWLFIATLLGFGLSFSKPSRW